MGVQRNIALGIFFVMSFLSVSMASSLDEFKKIDTSMPGKYVITYTVTDTFGNVSVKKRDVTIRENQPPIIILNGSDYIKIYQNDTFEDPGVIATDAEDGNLTAKVNISGNVDTNNPGIYLLQYEVSDSLNKKATITRTVEVLKASDIRENIVKPSSYDLNHEYELWDYFANTTDSSTILQKFTNEMKDTNEIRRIEVISNDELLHHFNYTGKVLSYKKDDGEVKISFLNQGEVEKEVLLKTNIKMNDTISVDENNSCKLISHYDEIELSNEKFTDVIKIECPNKSIAYFAKDKGIVVENKINSASIETNSVSNDIFIDNSDNQLGFDVNRKTFDNVLLPDNWDGIVISNTDKVYEDPYNLSGEGLTVGVIDSGSARNTHVEFDDRVTNLTTQSVSDHTTHVAGTIAAQGIKKDARGYANKVKVKVKSYKETYFGSSMKMFYEDYGINITNHSYGYSSMIYLGEYETTARYADYLVTKYSTIIAVKAAGNDRDDPDYPKYGITKAFCNAKNIITTGAVDINGKLAYFSSTGPVSNGRIKPDFVAKGYHVYSVGISSDTYYKSMSGTSMAAPAMTGIVTLLEEEYKKVNGELFRLDTVKAILANTAKDLGRKGPDYEYGYGIPDTLEAVKVIETMETNESLVKNITISPNEFHQYNIEIIEDETVFKASLSWIDPVANSSADTADANTILAFYIVNNETKETVYSYSLDKDNPEDLAVQNKLNEVDTLKQIETKLDKGSYSLYIVPLKLDVVVQDYTLVTNFHIEDAEVKTLYGDIKEFETTIYESENE